MDINEAFKIVGQALDIGTQAAHGAGLINRSQVETINSAEAALRSVFGELAQTNEQLAGQITAMAKAEADRKPCDCEEKESA